jgi:hypothetical protein
MRGRAEVRDHLVDIAPVRKIHADLAFGQSIPSGLRYIRRALGEKVQDRYPVVCTRLLLIVERMVVYCDLRRDRAAIKTETGRYTE